MATTASMILKIAEHLRRLLYGTATGVERVQAWWVTPLAPHMELDW